MTSGFSPFIVGIGGTTRPNSTSEQVLALALKAAEAKGARTQIFGGEFLAALPIFNPQEAAPCRERTLLAEAVRRADGLVIATPGYHGSMSGLIKNAIDGLEDLSGDLRPYFEGRAVGSIVVVDGWQAAGSTLGALRAVVHALRGWNTPMGAAVNGAAARDSGGLFDAAGNLKDARDAGQVRMVAEQVVAFARMTAASKADA